MRIEAALDRLQELDILAEKIREMKPWDYLDSSNLIFIIPEDGEKAVLCSIEGKRGETKGISSYIGIEGIKDYDMVSTVKDTQLNPKYVEFEQSKLACKFEEIEGKETAKFHSYKKRYFPYDLDGNEVEQLIKIYTQLIVVLDDYISGNIKINFKENMSLTRKYDIDTMQWVNCEEKSITETRLYPYIEIVDEVLVMRLKKQQKTRDELYMDFAYLPTKYEDPTQDRPITKLIFIVIDKDSGEVVELNVVPQDTNEIDTVLQFFVDYIMENGLLKCIRTRNPWIHSTLANICNLCDVTVMEDPCVAIDKMLFGVTNIEE